jgi:hypothetical protein
VFQIDTDVLAPTPVKTGLADEVLQLADSIRDMREVEDRLWDAWNEWTNKIGERRRLEEVLKNDKRRIEGRDETPPLTVGVPFYPDENEEVLRPRFDRFVVSGE